MLKPHYDEDDIPYVFLPFLKDTIDMDLSHTTQQIIDAEISFALNGNWNATDWGNRTDFWKYLITKYGHYRIMKQYTEVVDNSLVCDHLLFNVGAYPVLIANHEKYDRLAKALKEQYNVLEPYYMDEEHSEGSKSADTTMENAQQTNTNYETSMDDTANSYQTGKVVADKYDDVVKRKHDQSTQFKGSSFESGSDETHHRMDYRHGNIGNQSQADLIEKEIELARTNLWDVIAKDLLDNICLKIFYSSC